MARSNPGHSFVLMMQCGLSLLALRWLLSRIGKRDLYIHAPLSAENGNGNGVPAVMLVQCIPEILLARNLLPIDCSNEVGSKDDRCEPKRGVLRTPMQTCTIRGTIRENALNEHAIIYGQS